MPLKGFFSLLYILYSNIVYTIYNIIIVVTCVCACEYYYIATVLFLKNGSLCCVGYVSDINVGNMVEGIIGVNGVISHFKVVNFGFNVFLVCKYGFIDFRGNLSRFLGVRCFAVCFMVRHKNYSIHTQYLP